ncbi:hypothetical protein B0A61_04505 [Flavobacterium aquatile LMG 4008 = ATCC 11947]|uniref:Uncharacterized protein n=1 Tax=Flavobacterium aquatile LMG 4008 = ATCC 11947 TaxID=1453498 RepID=A0A095SU59_9FLAO|nr:hypothetical protein LG45_07275 [Flavobacterium aquatile LMG 4008 = ATCC 11947]OXA68971.1 hypothetical protein B0A61_04505 [Flavobacterium aquatile LMG 4008 = ATCC 11947]
MQLFECCFVKVYKHSFSFFFSPDWSKYPLLFFFKIIKILRKAGTWITDKARAIRSLILQNIYLQLEHKKKDKLVLAYPLYL